MKLFFLLLFCVIGRQLCIGQELQFSMPLKGVPGKDFFIDGYPDHDSTDGIRDIFCGNKTYNGHKGTDMSLSGYKSMDTGVCIFAAASGRIFEVNDGMYDRSKHWIGGGLGNHVAIVHKDGICTYYGHMMKNSLMVKMGDSVLEGQPIGKVGSSGYSKCPHLHFEVRNKNRQVIDPFLGTCSTRNTSYWKEQPPYDTSTFVIDDGFVPYRPGVDTLQEGYLVTDTFAVKTDTTVYFWARVHELHKGDILRVEWYMPNHALYHSCSYECKWDGPYTWPFIKMPRDRGKWTVKFFVNNRFLASRNFYVVKRRSE
jgi:hypothetical protein